MKILLVDDHTVFREALGSLLVVLEPSCDIVGAVATSREAIEAAESLKPDVVLMDIMLDGPSGITAVRELRRRSLPCRVLILTALVEPSFVVDALEAGVDGYALKEQSIEEIRAAIHEITRGVRYIVPRLRGAQGTADHNDRTAEAGPGGIIDRLSDRERDVFALVVAGHTNDRISSELFISVKTVETHRTHINKKLHVHSSVELLRLAALNGLVSA